MQGIEQVKQLLANFSAGLGSYIDERSAAVKELFEGLCQLDGKWGWHFAVSTQTMAGKVAVKVSCDHVPAEVRYIVYDVQAKTWSITDPGAVGLYKNDTMLRLGLNLRGRVFEGDKGNSAVVEVVSALTRHLKPNGR